MSRFLLRPIERPDVVPRPISPRLRSQLVYFSAPAEAEGVPSLGPDECFFREAEVDRWLDEGVLLLVSPLDTANMTEVELEEEQEAMLGWIKANRAWRVRIEET